MKRQMLVFLLLLLSLTVGATGAAPDPNLAPRGADSAPHQVLDRPMEWELLQYFGDETYGDLPWYQQMIIDGGFGLGCGSIGFGVSMLNPFAGFAVAYGCELGFAA